MTKAVLEASSEGAAEHAAAAVPLPASAVPASLHASLMARLDRLGDAEEVVQIGAAMRLVLEGARNVEARVHILSFDHLVGAGEQRERESDAERLGSLEINDQLDLRDSHPCVLTQRQLQLLEPR